MTKKSKLSKVSFISTSILFLAFILNSTTSFSQVQTIDFPIATSIVNDDTVTVTSTREASLETNFSFVSWFMGKKQSVKENVSKDASSTKRLLINSGVTPNRLLMKAFLKKAQNQTASIA